jgi:hypothetical protein
MVNCSGGIFDDDGGCPSRQRLSLTPPHVESNILLGFEVPGRTGIGGLTNNAWVIGWEALCIGFGSLRCAHNFDNSNYAAVKCWRRYKTNCGIKKQRS